MFELNGSESVLWSSLRLDSDDLLDINGYVFYILRLGYIDDFEDLS